MALAGSSLPRKESLTAKCRRLGIKVSKPVQAVMTREPVVRSDRYSRRKHPPTVKFNLRDSDPAFDLVAKFSDAQWERLQRCAFDPKFRKPRFAVVESSSEEYPEREEETEGQLEGGFSVVYLKQEHPRNDEKEHRPVWWWEDQVSFERLYQNWLGGGSESEKFLADFKRQILKEWFHDGRTDKEILAAHRADFKARRKGSRFVQAASGAAEFRRTILREGDEFFFDGAIDTEPRRPDFNERRIRREHWKSIREAPDVFGKKDS